MYKFMSSAGIMAYSMDAKHAGDRTADRLGAAKQCSAGMASAEPISVWGRLNRQTRVRKEGFLSLVDDDAADDDVVVVVEGGESPLIPLLIIPLAAVVIEVLGCAASVAALVPPPPNAAGTSDAATMDNGDPGLTIRLDERRATLLGNLARIDADADPFVCVVVEVGEKAMQQLYGPFFTCATTSSPASTRKHLICIIVGIRVA